MHVDIPNKYLSNRYYGNITCGSWNDSEQLCLFIDNEHILTTTCNALNNECELTSFAKVFSSKWFKPLNKIFPCLTKGRRYIDDEYRKHFANLKKGKNMILYSENTAKINFKLTKNCYSFSVKNFQVCCIEDDIMYNRYFEFQKNVTYY